MNFKLTIFAALLSAAWFCAQNGLAAGEDHFRTGSAAYEAGQYYEAARAFRESLAQQTASGTLLNLGLAEWRCGRAGEAVLAWEQSAWLDPFNRAARDNLLHAQETVQINPPELTWCEQASTWLPANFWAWIAGVSWWSAMALVVVPGFFRMKKAGWHQTAAALALGIFLLSLAPATGIFTRSKIGIVTTKNTSLRLTPTQSAEVIAVLAPGEAVRELRRRDQYVFVHTQNGNGWVERRQIGLLVPE